MVLTGKQKQIFSNFFCRKTPSELALTTDWHLVGGSDWARCFQAKEPA